MENRRLSDYNKNGRSHNHGKRGHPNKKGDHGGKPPSPMELALISKYKEICQNPQKYPRESQWIAPRNKSIRGV